MPAFKVAIDDLSLFSNKLECRFAASDIIVQQD